MNEPGTTAESGACPACGSADIKAMTTVDLAFGEEIPCKECETCGHVFDRGTYPGE